MSEIDFALQEFKQQLDEFIAGPIPNQYVYGEDVISVYTRKGTHAIDGAIFDCLDIARITIAERFQCQGIGFKVIDHMHRINPFRVTYIESVLTDRFYDRLIAEHWTDLTRGIGDRNVYKFKPLKNGDPL